jgi:hypothetical protein
VNNILRNMILAPVVMAAAALATNTAMADTTLKVPFSFTVAGKTCPAGLYLVKRGTSSNLVTLQNKETAQAFSWIIGPGDPTPSDLAVTLKFDEMGDAHALRSVQVGPWITSRLDKKTKQNEHIAPQVIQAQ